MLTPLSARQLQQIEDTAVQVGVLLQVENDNSLDVDRIQAAAMTLMLLPLLEKLVPDDILSKLGDRLAESIGINKITLLTIGMEAGLRIAKESQHED